MIKRMLSSTINSSIIISQNDWNKIFEINTTHKGNFLFSATGGGCNGFNYKLNIIDDNEYEQIISERKTKIKPTIIQNKNSIVLVDPLSEFLLLGTTIDYINEDYSKGIYENKFIFIPDKNFASTCGCGTSFTPKQNK